MPGYQRRDQALAFPRWACQTVRASSQVRRSASPSPAARRASTRSRYYAAHVMGMAFPAGSVLISVWIVVRSYGASKGDVGISRGGLLLLSLRRAGAGIAVARPPSLRPGSGSAASWRASDPQRRVDGDLSPASPSMIRARFVVTRWARVASIIALRRSPPRATPIVGGRSPASMIIETRWEGLGAHGG